MIWIGILLIVFGNIFLGFFVFLVINLINLILVKVKVIIWKVKMNFLVLVGKNLL